MQSGDKPTIVTWIGGNTPAAGTVVTGNTPASGSWNGGNRPRGGFSYLLNEDGTYLLLEGGGRIIISLGLGLQVGDGSGSVSWIPGDSV
jgi:hypothetical protein